MTTTPTITDTDRPTFTARFETDGASGSVLPLAGQTAEEAIASARAWIGYYSPGQDERISIMAGPSETIIALLSWDAARRTFRELRIAR